MSAVPDLDPLDVYWLTPEEEALAWDEDDDAPLPELTSEAIVAAARVPRTLPPAILTGPSELWGLVNTVYLLQTKRRVNAASNPVVVSEPRRGDPPMRGRPEGWHSPSAGKGPWHEGRGPHDGPGDGLQESDQAFVLGRRAPILPAGKRHRRWGLPADFESEETRFSVQAADRNPHFVGSTTDHSFYGAKYLKNAIRAYCEFCGLTTDFEPHSDRKRGEEERRPEACYYTASILAVDLGHSLNELRLSTRQGKGGDPLTESRQQLARSLRVRDYCTADIAEVLDRPERTVQRWTQGIEPAREPRDSGWPSPPKWSTELREIKRAVADLEHEGHAERQDEVNRARTLAEKARRAEARQRALKAAYVERAQNAVSCDLQGAP